MVRAAVMPVYIRTTAELEARIPTIAASPSVALDTEFHPEKAYTPRLMLLQLRPARGDSLLIDPLDGVDLGLLSTALAGATLLIHGGTTDLSLLALHTGLHARRVVDSQLAAAFCGLGWPRRLQDLALTVLGRTLTKQCTVSDWSHRPLSQDQLRYAADDVELLHELTHALLARVTALGNLAWFEAAQAEAAAAALVPTDPERAWRRVPGAHLLNDAERAALQALAAWRERRARDADQPPHQILVDAMMFDIARRRPTSIDSLRENRRMHAGVWKFHGEEILERLRTAEGADPPAALRRGARVDALRLAARIAAAARGMEGDLLLTDDELLATEDPDRAPSWRREALGPEFDQFVEGSTLIDAQGRLVRGGG